MEKISKKGKGKKVGKEIIFKIKLNIKILEYLEKKAVNKNIQISNKNMLLIKKDQSEVIEIKSSH